MAAPKTEVGSADGHNPYIIMVFCMCPSTPPEKVTTKSSSRQASQSFMLAAKDNPHQFALSLKDACCSEPCCCILAGAAAPCGLTSCWARKAVLEKYHNGYADYRCCQGYIPRCCCIDFPNTCVGSQLGLLLEGCCCPVFSLSIARIHLMESKRIRPDPMDWQIIHCSNCLQLASCVFSLAAIFLEQARDAAQILDVVADCFTLSVAGCMGAQVHHEIKKDSTDAGIVFVVVEGVPVGDPVRVTSGGGLAAQDSMGEIHADPPLAMAVPVGQPTHGGGAPPEAEEMAR